MKRREFIRNTALFSASTFLLPTLSRGAGSEKGLLFSPLESLQLTDFADEQDESPVLFQNRRHSFLTTLRRMEYPSDKEIVSLFELKDGVWKEQSPVTASEGSYEAVTADCHAEGSPAVAWTQIDGGQWTIQATVQVKGAFPQSVPVSDPAKRSINPVVKATGPDGFVLAWESFEEGKFCIYLSRYQAGAWTEPFLVTDKAKQSFDPALEVDGEGKVYVAYDVSDGPHRNIELRIIAADASIETVPVALGGGFANRVNVNVKPSIAFDKSGRLWITWENNRFATRLEDGDNYTGDRCCAMVCYHEGNVYEQKDTGRWLFTKKNDHWPSFRKDFEGNLYALTHCGGDFSGAPFWSFRVSRLDPNTGWSEPETLLETRQKGESIKPTVAFARDSSSFWLAWKSDRYAGRDAHANLEKAGQTVVRRGMVEANRFLAPPFASAAHSLRLVPAIVEEHHPVADYAPVISGRTRSRRHTMQCQGETYTLLMGNFHEHSEISSCWPAGTDGTLHDDYRFGLTSEGYDFMGITDHGYSLTEVYWRKHLRLAEFYNDGSHFVAFPTIEWTLSNKRDFAIRRGAGHRNIVFRTVEDAKKFIRNGDEVYSVRNLETEDAEKLWAFIHARGIDCISIPHHPADEVHAVCWETRDEELEPIVEIFQCRGNAEYRGAPRMLNVMRHKPTENDKAFVDYALREKKHKLGFIASGDHNGIGVGLACMWVKEVSREGIFEAMKNRRVFGTTGDQIEIDFRIDGVLQGQTITLGNAPRLSFDIQAAKAIKSLEILRNSRVIHRIEPKAGSVSLVGNYVDSAYAEETDVLYYYVRIIQENDEIGWSSPLWLES